MKILKNIMQIYAIGIFIYFILGISKVIPNRFYSEKILIGSALLMGIYLLVFDKQFRK